MTSTSWLFSSPPASKGSLRMSGLFDWWSLTLALHIAPGETYVSPSSQALLLLTIVWLSPWSEFQLLLHNTPHRSSLIDHQDMIRWWQICVSQNKGGHRVHAAPSVFTANFSSLSKNIYILMWLSGGQCLMTIALLWQYLCNWDSHQTGLTFWPQASVQQRVGWQQCADMKACHCIG